MIFTEEELKNMTPEELLEKIKGHKELLSQLVGNLYPQIVWDEIIKMREKYSEITGNISCPE